MPFSGKNIIVTGASGDLGTAITQRLISTGRSRSGSGTPNTAGLSRLAAEVSGPGVLETFVADVSHSEQALGYATRASELWEGRRLRQQCRHSDTGASRSSSFP